MCDRADRAETQSTSQVWDQSFRSKQTVIDLEGGPIIGRLKPFEIHSRGRATLKVTTTIRLTVFCVMSLGFPVYAHSAAKRLDAFAAVGLPSRIDFVTPQQPVQVQPRGWQFAPPFKSDLSPDSARAVDELYSQLMREYLGCSSVTTHSPGRRCKVP
jgi:hypothetical protein